VRASNAPPFFARRRYAEQSRFALDDDEVVTMVRPIEARDVKAWALMRARLWPEADAAGLTREAQAYVAGNAGDILAAAFVAEDEAASRVGFIEVGVRPYSDGCDSMPVPHVEEGALADRPT
jgi:hypothetical protein